ASGASVSGEVTVTLTKGKKAKSVTATLTAGKAVVKLPRLAKGKWKASVAYAGDTAFESATSKVVTIKVKKK
ncbi:hypothetical protein, partial [Nocardioides sp.]|uniref:hypothetical protein n=1 Tax=Nocardioides sp. TaxID=35761 RepID=UPI0039E3DF51